MTKPKRETPNKAGEKLSEMWMGKEYKYPIQSPFVIDQGHWFLRRGVVVIEATTREGCLKKAKEGSKKILEELQKRDRQKYG